VIAALHPAGFPVPNPLHLCEDPDVVGAPFSVMSYVDGRTLILLEDYAGLDRTTVARPDELLVDPDGSGLVPRPKTHHSELRKQADFRR
jgi:aminoglycoside phosphotransferase (APT) family kinase protein